MERNEIQMFVLWEKARVAEERILADIATRAEIVASFEAKWPDGIPAQAGYDRFYGALLPDAAEKAKRSGAGSFVVVIVRFPNPRHDWRMTRHGLEYVNLDMYDLKWNYREWVGGNNRVHGTLTDSEARRDIMLMTGHSVDKWIAGSVSAKDVRVLPGQDGWRDLNDLFAVLNDIHPYVVLRNADELPAGFDPVHGDVDLLVQNASECARCLKARKLKGGAAAYGVRVDGKEVHFDIREIGDGYYDERWERGILNRRTLNARGFYEPAAEDAFHSLLYHCLFQKSHIAPDYYGKLKTLAATAGVEGKSPADWATALDAFLRVNGYGCPRPVDSSVKLNRTRAEWRRAADEAADLFGLTDVRPVVPSYRTLELEAKMDGQAVRIWHVPSLDGQAVRSYDMGRIAHEKVPSIVDEPRRWHNGRCGSYAVYAAPKGRPLLELLERGELPGPAGIDAIAESARSLIADLDTAKIVHRDISAETLYVAEDGSLSLGGFQHAVKRTSYRYEPTFLRRNLIKGLIPLGGEGVLRPGEWNDRYALAQCLKRLPATAALSSVIETLEADAKAGKGLLKANLKKLRLRLLMLYVEVVFRGILSPRRRKSAIFRRIRAFAGRALF